MDIKLLRARALVTRFEDSLQTSQTRTETHYLLQLMYLAGAPIIPLDYSVSELLATISFAPGAVSHYVRRAKIRLDQECILESWEYDFIQSIMIPLAQFMIREEVYA